MCCGATRDRLGTLLARRGRPLRLFVSRRIAVGTAHDLAIRPPSPRLSELSVFRRCGRAAPFISPASLYFRRRCRSSSRGGPFSSSSLLRSLDRFDWDCERSEYLSSRYHCDDSGAANERTRAYRAKTCPRFPGLRLAIRESVL